MMQILFRGNCKNQNGKKKLWKKVLSKTDKGSVMAGGIVLLMILLLLLSSNFLKLQREFVSLENYLKSLEKHQSQISGR